MKQGRKSYLIMGSFLIAGSLFAAQGCVATRDWVREQMEPVSTRVTQGETRLNQAEGQIGAIGGRVTGVEGKMGQMDEKLGQFDAKTEKALSGLANLRLERKFVVDLKEGATFAINVATLPADAKRGIDGFLSDLKGDPAGMEGAIFLVAGHTDNVGSEDYNYELSRRRAEGVARYLITQKSVDPLRVVTASYGMSTPVADNNTQQGRAKNRRVEIMIYRDGVTSTQTAAAAFTPLADAGSVQPAGEVLTQR
jgi:outer membrane protein OmpA-like peptidoglycan-associated protein